MPVEQFSRDAIASEPGKAHDFLEFLEANSYGYVPREWPEKSTTEIIDLATEFYAKIENEINILEYLRTTNYLLN